MCVWVLWSDTDAFPCVCWWAFDDRLQFNADNEGQKVCVFAYWL